MGSWCQVALIFAALAPQTFAGFPSNIAGFSFSGDYKFSNLCGKTVDDANITGVYRYNPDFIQLQQVGQPDNHAQSTLPVNVLATLQEVDSGQNASVQWSLWFAPNGANYSDDFRLLYDVCAYAVEPTSWEYFARAQDDDGSCTTAMNPTCVSDIQSIAEKYALQMTLNPDSGAQKAALRSGDTNLVCQNIRDAIRSNFPGSCKPYFNQSTPLDIGGGALTAYNHSLLYEQCTLLNSTTNNTYYHVDTYDQYTFKNVERERDYYDVFAGFSVPLLLIFMPVANSYAPQDANERAAAKLLCVRPTDTVAGSRTPPSAQQFFQNLANKSSHSGLSGGDIAGIVVGVVAVVALIAGGAFFLWRRRRKQAKKLETFDTNEKTEPPVDAANGSSMDTTQEHKPAVEAADTPLNELNADAAAEKPGTDRRPVELEGEEDAKLEKEAEQPPAELPAHVPGSRQ